jgi:hypothetical protein
MYPRPKKIKNGEEKLKKKNFSPRNGEDFSLAYRSSLSLSLSILLLVGCNMEACS